MHQSIVQWVCSLLLLVGVANALKFELHAHSGGENHNKERCIRNFVQKDTLVAVKATVDGYKGDGMVVNIFVRPHHEADLLSIEAKTNSFFRFATKSVTNMLVLET